MDIGEGKQQMIQAQALLLQHNSHEKHEDQWLIMEEGDDYDDDIYNTSSSFDNSSTTTNGSTSSSSDVVDDASSPTSTLSSSTNSTSPLYELSELMVHLPIKRGLSNFYQGKSQSFTSLSRVASIEDLPKKEITPYTRKMKASKSYANGLDSYKPYTLPKAIISKKVSRSCLSFPSRRGSFLTSSRPPLAPIQKKF